MVLSALRRVLGRDPKLTSALDGPDPLRVKRVPALAWSGHVSLWWLALGPLSSPVMRYVALWGQGALDGVTLTGDASAFERATLASIKAPEREAPVDVGLARRLGLLFLETTRPMDCETLLLTSESAVEDDQLRVLTELVFTDPRSAAERTELATRFARLGRNPPAGFGFELLMSDTGPLAQHALPARCLDADERHRLDRSLTERLHPLERETGATFGEAWPTLIAEPDARPPALAPFGATSLSLEERRGAVETFMERRESPRVQPVGDRVRFQALVAVGERPGLIELTFWRDGRLRASYTPLSG